MSRSRRTCHSGAMLPVGLLGDARKIALVAESMASSVACHHLGPANAGADLVHPEGGIRVDDLLTATDAHAHQQVYDFVGAVAGHDAFQAYSEVVRQSMAQAALEGIGVQVVLVELAQRLGDLGGRSVGVLVAVEL